ITGAAEVGRMWRHRMAGRVPPEPKAASTYSLWRTASTRERDRRAKVAIEVMPTAIAALVVPKPSRITTDSDSSRPGMASSTSTTRIRASSTRPPTAPAITPMVVPTTRPTVTATIAAVIEWEAPWTTRENTSRPVASVPNQWSPLGACREGPAEAVGLKEVKSSGASVQARASSSTRADRTTVGPAVTRRRAPGAGRGAGPGPATGSGSAAGSGSVAGSGPGAETSEPGNGCSSGGHRRSAGGGRGAGAPQPGVQDRVNEVHDQVDQHEHDRGQH